MLKEFRQSQQQENQQIAEISNQMVANASELLREYGEIENVTPVGPFYRFPPYDILRVESSCVQIARNINLGEGEVTHVTLIGRDFESNQFVIQVENMPNVIEVNPGEAVIHKMEDFEELASDQDPMFIRLGKANLKEVEFYQKILEKLTKSFSKEEEEIEAVRSPQEIRDMIAHLERLIEGYSVRGAGGTDPVSQSLRYISALKWTLGEDTLVHVPKPPQK